MGRFTSAIEEGLHALQKQRQEGEEIQGALSALAEDMGAFVGVSCTIRQGGNNEILAEFSRIPAEGVVVRKRFSLCGVDRIIRYPLRVFFGGDSLLARDREGLEAALVNVVSKPSTARNLQEIQRWFKGESED